MPKSKNNRKGKKRVGDRRPVARSGRNEGPADYRTAKPVDGPGAPPDRQCPYLDRIAMLPNVFTPEECNQIINTALNDWEEKESMIQRDKGTEIKQNFEEDLDYRNTTLFIPKAPDEWLFQKIAGFLLIIPGFVTDLLGIILLLKPLRGYVWNNFIFRKGFYKDDGARKKKDENIIEADYRDLDEK